MAIRYWKWNTTLEQCSDAVKGSVVKSCKLTNGSGLRLKFYYFDPAIENAVFWSGISWLDSSALIGRLPMARRGEEVVNDERFDPQCFTWDCCF